MSTQVEPLVTTKFSALRVSVLLPAAGSGSRLGMGEKAFLKLQGKSLLEWNLQAFAWAEQVVVAVPKGTVLDLSAYPNATTVVGGTSRQDSVCNMLQAANQPWVMVHDVARPFVAAAALERLKQAMAAGVQAATLAIPIADTLVRHWVQLETEAQLNLDAKPMPSSHGQLGLYGTTLERSAHMLIQTPQVFKRELLQQAHALEPHAAQATDDAQMVMALGVPVHLIEGDRCMFKITYPADWHLAQALAAYGGTHDL